MTFSLPGMSREDFFRDYWRKRPLFIKGGAEHLLQPSVSESELDQAFVQLAEIDPKRIRRSGDNVIFGLRIDHVIPRLRSLARRFVADFGFPSVGFDGIKALGGHSIGSHYDYSDNFVLQQSGIKHWRLHPPDIIPGDQLRRRILGDPNLGPVYMPEGALEFVLEPGDLLYLPLFWPHWGVSQGPSTSVSLLIDAESAMDEIVPVLVRALSEAPSFWSPLPATSLDLAEVDPPMPDAWRQVFHNLAQALTEPNLMEGVARQFWNNHINRLRTSAAMVLHEQTNSDPAPRELAIDMQWARGQLQAALPPLEVGKLVLPDSDPNTFGTLCEYTYRPYLKRFLITCAKAFSFLRDDTRKRSLHTLVRGLQQLDRSVLCKLFLRPEMTSWIWRTAEAIDFAFAPRIELMFEHLGTFLWPVLLAHGVLPERETIVFAPSSANEVHLFQLGRGISTEHALPNPLTLVLKNETIYLGPSPEIEIPVGAIVASNRVETNRVCVAPLPSTQLGHIVVLRTSAWFSEFFPKTEAEGRASPLYLDIPDDELNSLREEMNRAMHLLDKHWPAARAEIERGIGLILPVHSRGLRAHNASVAGFRGLITSSVRPAYMLAQSLVHEAGHNKLSSLLDVVRLSQNADDELFYSPFVDTSRPITALIHGVYAFLQDIHITRRMLSGGVAGLSEAPMEKYLQKIEARVRSTVATIRAHARLTEHGEVLVSGIERGLES